MTTRAMREGRSEVICKTCTQTVDLSEIHRCTGLWQERERQDHIREVLNPSYTNARDTDGLDLRDYRARMDVAVEGLGIVLAHFGDGTEAMRDDEIVERAAAKLKLLGEMLLAAGVSVAMLRAVMKA